MINLEVVLPFKIEKVLYGLDVLKKIKYDEKSEYVLRPDFILKFRMLVN